MDKLYLDMHDGGGQVRFLHVEILITLRFYSLLKNSNSNLSEHLDKKHARTKSDATFEFIQAAPTKQPGLGFNHLAVSGVTTN